MAACGDWGCIQCDRGRGRRSTGDWVSAVSYQKEGYLLPVDFARQARSVSRGADAFRRIRESLCAPTGWRDGEDSMLGAACERGKFSGVCHQLRAPWMPGALVSAVGAVYVSLPWRRLLCRWRAGFRASGARALSISVQG